MKRFVSLLLVILLCSTALIACSSEPSDGGNTDDTQKTDQQSIISISTDHYQINNAMVSYFFNSYYRSDVANYSSYLSILGLDTNVSLKEQQYGDGTWFDFYLEAAVANIKANVLFAEYAMERGIELSEEELAGIDDYMASIEEQAKSKNTTAEQLIIEYYGNSVTPEVVREVLKLQQLSYDMYSTYLDELSFTDEECDGYYAENTDNFLYADYCKYTIAAEINESMTEIEANKVLLAAKDQATALGESADLEEFNKNLTAYLTELYADDDEKNADYIEDEVNSALLTNVLLSDIKKIDFEEGAEYKTGLYTVVRENNNFTVYFLASDPARRDDITRDVRHIMLTSNSYETEEAAKAKADEILAEYLEGEQTAEAFAALAEKYSEDTSSNKVGGLFEGLANGAITDASFNDWVFDADRVVGDTAIVTTSSGVHVMYYGGENLPKWKLDVIANLKMGKYYEKIEELSEKYSYTENEENLNLLEA